MPTLLRLGRLRKKKKQAFKSAESLKPKAKSFRYIKSKRQPLWLPFAFIIFQVSQIAFAIRSLCEICWLFALSFLP
jgi:hypothetical protein